MNAKCLDEYKDAVDITNKICEYYQITVRNTNPITESNRGYWIVKTSKRNRPLWKDRRINLQKLIVLAKKACGDPKVFDSEYEKSLTDYQEYQSHHMCRNKKCCNPNHIMGFISRDIHKKLDVAGDFIKKGKTSLPLVKEMIKQYPKIISPFSSIEVEKQTSSNNYKFVEHQGNSHHYDKYVSKTTGKVVFCKSRYIQINVNEINEAANHSDISFERAFAEIVSHEQLHKAIMEVEGHKATSMFDNICEFKILREGKYYNVLDSMKDWFGGLPE